MTSTAVDKIAEHESHENPKAKAATQHFHKRHSGEM